MTEGDAKLDLKVKQYEYFTTQLRYLDDKIFRSFLLFIQLATAIVGGRFYIEAHPKLKHTQLLIQLSHWVFVAIGLGIIFLISNNLRSWYDYRKKLKEDYGTDVPALGRVVWQASEWVGCLGISFSIAAFLSIDLSGLYLWIQVFLWSVFVAGLPFLLKIIFEKNQSAMEEINMKDSWISFAGTIIAALIVSGVTYYSVQSGVHIFKLEQEAKRTHEIMQERKSALFDALQVIDLVYANERLNNEEPLNPNEWDLSLARNAVNKILIYCEKPKNTVTAFNKAIGLYNPKVENSAGGVQPKYLDEFRKRVTQELGLPEFSAADPEKTWIRSLAGTKEAKEFEKRKKDIGKQVGNGTPSNT